MKHNNSTYLWTCPFPYHGPTLCFWSEGGRATHFNWLINGVTGESITHRTVLKLRDEMALDIFSHIKILEHLVDITLHKSIGQVANEGCERWLCWHGFLWPPTRTVTSVTATSVTPVTTSTISITRAETNEIMVHTVEACNLCLHVKLNWSVSNYYLKVKATHNVNDANGNVNCSDITLSLMARAPTYYRIQSHHAQGPATVSQSDVNSISNAFGVSMGNPREVGKCAMPMANTTVTMYTTTWRSSIQSLW